MSSAIYMAASGALSQQIRLEVLSNNLANVNTVGFKADLVTFETAALPEPVPLVATSESLPAPASIESVSLAVDQYTDFAQGQLTQTGSPLDTAINGDGFFAVQTPEGIAYTRNGNFTLSADGLLTTQEGYPVLGDGGEISIEGETFDIDSQGNINVEGGSIGRIRVVDFDKPYALQKIGTNLFVPEDTQVEPQDAEFADVKQGFLEGANVAAIKMMTEMIETIRMFESYQKAMKAIDQANAQTINEVGST